MLSADAIQGDRHRLTLDGGRFVMDRGSSSSLMSLPQPGRAKQETRHQQEFYKLTNFSQGYVIVEVELGADVPPTPSMFVLVNQFEEPDFSPKDLFTVDWLT